MYRLVQSGHVDPRRYVQIGLRGYWAGEAEFAWWRECGTRSFAWWRECGTRSYFMHDVTPEPGGMTAGDLLWACRTIARSVGLVGADVVEVLPEHVGSRDITAPVADRIAREILTGVAMGRAAN